MPPLAAYIQQTLSCVKRTVVDPCPERGECFSRQDESISEEESKKREELLKGPEGEIQNKKTLKKLREDREGKLGV